MRVSRRVLHSLRFALATLVAVYALGVAWEVIDVFLRGDVAEGLTAAETLRFNERIWRTIAGIEALVVFLIRLSDVRPDPPSWLFAAATAVWLGAASVAVGNALEEGHWRLAVTLVVVAVGVWFAVHRRIPGWPGAAAVTGPSAEPASGPDARELR